MKLEERRKEMTQFEIKERIAELREKWEFYKTTCFDSQNFDPIKKCEEIEAEIKELEKKLVI